MKLMITRIAPKELNGFTVVTDINLLDLMCDDSEADEILIDNFISQVPYNSIKNLLNLVLNKLRIGGVITIMDIDIDFMSHNISRGSIDIETLNNLLFSDGPVLSLHTIDTTIETLASRNIKIMEKFIDEGFTYVVRGQRC